mgnify:CR=1 FL=1|tara:strand:- start:45910 stop:47268 length:1359 start_codon:yes stop_codon:yes gene_type:complete
MKSIQVIVLLFFIHSFASLKAQEVWTLDDCVSYAIEHNLNLKDFEFNEASNKESYRQSFRNLLPSISGFTDYNIQYGRSTDPFTNDVTNTSFFSNNYSLSGSIALFQGFQKLNSIKASKFLYSAAKEDVNQQKYLLAFRVMSAFYDIKFIEGLVANSKEQQEISKTNYDLVKRQIDLGLKAGADLYEAESLLLTDQLTVTQTENRLQVAQLNLIQEMNLENVSSINLAFSIDEMSVEKNLQAVSLDSVFTTALGFIPIIKAQELRTKAAKKQVAVARGDLYPSLSFATGYGTGYYETNIDADLGEIIPFRTQIKDNTSRYIGISLNIPISDKWSRRSAVKQQKIAYSRAQNNLEIQEQELYKLLQQLVQDNAALKAEFIQSENQLESQKLAFDIANKKYEKGLISTLDLFQAKNLFATAQNTNLQVALKLRVNESTLDFYNGLPLFNINTNN